MESAHVHLMRRLLTIAIATLGLRIATMSIHNVLALVSAPFVGSASSFDRLLTGPVYTYVVAGVGLVAFVLLLLHWRQSEGRGTRVWYNEWSLGRLSLLALTLVPLNWAVPGVANTWQFTPPRLDSPLVWVMSALFWVSVVGMYVIWFWWTDAAKRSITQAFAVGGVWILFQLATYLSPGTFLITLGGGSMPTEFQSLGAWLLGNMEIAAYFDYRGISALGSAQFLIEHGFWVCVCTPILWGACRAWRWRTGAPELLTIAK